MYILAGKYKGKRLHSPKGDQTRPTTSLVRKALFDICRHEIEGAHFLDLFAGTGAIGLEALSRGAAHATFVEKNPLAHRTLTENLRLLKIDKSEASALKDDALTALMRLSKHKQRFDIIYLDPPYVQSASLLPEILTFLDTSHLLTQTGLLFLEERKTHGLPLDALPLKHLHLASTRRYGITHLHQFHYLVHTPRPSE